MRIAMIVWQFPALSETFILNQITGLIRQGHAVDIYAVQSTKPSGTISKVHPDVINYDLLSHTYHIPTIPINRWLRILKGLRLLYANSFKDPALLKSLNISRYGIQATSLKLLYRAIPFVGKEPYDIIHCQFGTLGLLGLSLQQVVSPKAKLITSFRGYDISQFIRRRGTNVYRPLFDTGDFFLTNCEYFRHRLLKLGCDPTKVVVHRSGIDCSRFHFSPRTLQPQEPVQIVTTGRLVEKKGIEYSIRAVAKLSKTNPNIKYSIIGDGPLKADLQHLIHQLDIGSVVQLLGWKEQQEVIDILQHSHIFVAPSITAADGDQDAPVNTLKEAMAMGLPVVSTVHGGIPELVKDSISGLLVPERDASALAEKLGYLINNPEVWPEMGHAGRAYVEEHYETNNLNDQLVEIYRQQLNLGVGQEELERSSVLAASRQL